MLISNCIVLLLVFSRKICVSQKKTFAQSKIVIKNYHLKLIVITIISTMMNNKKFHSLSLNIYRITIFPTL